MQIETRRVGFAAFKDDYEIPIRRSKDHLPTIPKLGLMQSPHVVEKYVGGLSFGGQSVIQPEAPSFVIAHRISEQNITLESRPKRKKEQNLGYNYKRVIAKGDDKYNDTELRYWYKRLTNITVHESTSRAKLLELHKQLN